LFCKKEEMYQKCNHVDTHGRVYPKRLSIIWFCFAKKKRCIKSVTM
jgi:hypothetical protein